MALLSRDEILAAVKTRAEDYTSVDVPEWGGQVLLRRLSAADAERSGLTSGDDTDEQVARVLAMSVVDEEGNLLFTEDDIKELAKIDVGVAAQVFTTAVKINGLGSEELDKAVAAFTEAQRDNSSSN
jgi:hypothetical protein